MLKTLTEQLLGSLQFDIALPTPIHVSLTPLLSNLAVSTTNTVNLMFNAVKMAKATNESQ
jgi:hypothetical protein